MTHDISKYEERGNLNIQALDESGEMRSLESLEKILKVFGYVWDTDTLSAVRMQQPATADDLTTAIDGKSWKDTRIEYSSGNAEYVGKHETLNADTSDVEWWVRKFSYSGDDVVRIQGQITSWDDRTSGWS